RIGLERDVFGQAADFQVNHFAEASDSLGREFQLRIALARQIDDVRGGEQAKILDLGRRGHVQAIGELGPAARLESVLNSYAILAVRGNLKGEHRFGRIRFRAGELFAV